MTHFNSQRLGITLIVLAIVVLAITTPISLTAAILTVFFAVLGGFLIDG